MLEIDAEADPHEDLKRDLRDFVGRKADYYLARWAPALRGPETNTGFNWAAFLFGGLWLPYRKMYLVTTIFYGFLILETALEEIVFVGVLEEPEPPAALVNMVNLVIGLVYGAFGNRWYLTYARKAVAEVRAQNLDEDAAIDLLSRRGGTNFGVALAYFLAFCVVMVAAFVVLDVLLFGL